METKNAIITDTAITIGDHPGLSAWLYLDYGGAGQGFGGFCLYTEKDFLKGGKNFAGHFMFKCMQVVGVEKWADLKGKALRVRANWGGIESIGHIVKDVWFNPRADFSAARADNVGVLA